MPYLLPEIQEEILIRLNVRDLIRCKSVCKYWKYLISHPHFIKSHIDQSHLSDQKNDKIRHRRIVMCEEFEELTLVREVRYPNYTNLCSSSNGLVCVLSQSSCNEPLIINPSTREVRKLKSPQIPDSGPWCSGFGYDSSTDDYKVVLGFPDGFNSTCFKVFSFRSNIWKVVGEVNYLFGGCMGVFCEGALHWVASDKALNKNIILSFHLSEEKFREVTELKGLSYPWKYPYLRILLGILEGCLCAYKYDSLSCGWVMKDYGKNESWERFKCEDEIKYDVVHYLKQSQNYVPDSPLWNETMVHNVKLLLEASLYVETLVSPYFPKTLNRKRRATSTIKNPKLIKGDPSIPEPSARV